MSRITARIVVPLLRTASVKPKGPAPAALRFKSSTSKKDDDGVEDPAGRGVHEMLRQWGETIDPKHAAVADKLHDNFETARTAEVEELEPISLDELTHGLNDAPDGKEDLAGRGVHEMLHQWGETIDPKHAEMRAKWKPGKQD